ncbi:N-6 DNA methylase [Nostoc sp.]|uniref:N-6 DNA methylase n=1 Tax=Nostoc sp. TaxID=1180 RepID=UPI002FF7AF92
MSKFLSNKALHDVNSVETGSPKELQQQLKLFSEKTGFMSSDVFDLRSIRLLVSRLHDIFRDNDSQSNIISRFDEITKLVFAKIVSDKTYNSGASTPFSPSDLPINPCVVRKYYQHLSHQHSNLIPKRFSELDCSDSAIMKCVLALQSFNFTSTQFDVKGLAYEEIVRNTFDKGDHQQFFTPPHIVDFIVSACQPYLKGDICDPASGTGGFLSSIARHQINYSSLTSIEIDERLSWVSGINMLLHGAKNIRTVFIPAGGTLGNQANQFFSCFDAIITNPPFGSDFTESDVLETFELGLGKSSRRRGILFIERCHALLRKNGILAIILDEGVLNLSHATDVRQFIIKNFDLKAVISLPETAFMPYATVNASILIMSKKISAENRDLSVFFARADKVGRKTSGDEDIRYDEDGKNYLNSDLPSILNAWHKYLKEGRVDESENIYVADVYSNFDKETNGHRIDFQYHHPSRKKSQQLIATCIYPLKRLADICTERNVSISPCKELSGAIIRYTGLANIESNTGEFEQVPTPSDSLKSSVKMYQPGDIVFAKMRPNLRKVALMSFAEPGFVSSECSVFAVNKASNGTYLIDPIILSVLLRSDFVYGQIMHLVAGIGRPRINSKELLQVMIPLAPKDVQEEIRRQYLSQHQKVENLKSDIGSFLDRSQLMLTSSVQELVCSFIRSPKTTSFMPIENKEMAFTAESLRTFLRGESNPLDTLSWLTDFFLPEVLKRLNETDVRRRLGIYAGEKIPENERNLTDVRNRVSLIIEYELARLATRILEDHQIEDIFWSYVVANRFPDLEVRTSSGSRGLRVEVKCLQTIAEEKSANFDTLRKDIHPLTDFVIVFAWDWRYDFEDVTWDRAPFIHHAYAFHASSLALLRDWYWLNCPPNDLGNGLQGFDLRYAVNCKDSTYNEEEGNYGKLLRIWQEGFKYEPPKSDLVHRTIADYLAFKNGVIKAGLDTLAHLFLPGLSGSTEVVAVLYQNQRVGWQSGEVCFLLSSAVSTQKKQNLVLSQLTVSKVYLLTDKYAWREFEYKKGKLTLKRTGKKPKRLI